MERKEMVKKLGEFFDVKPTYLGVPSFAYEIVTAEETYTIDREGTITNSAGEERSFEEIVNTPIHEDAVKNDNQSVNFELEGMEITLPLEGHTGNTLKNIVNMLYSKQHLIMMAFETTEPLMYETIPKDFSKKETETIQDFKKVFEELGDGKMPGLTFDFENEAFTIKLAGKNLNSEKIAAFQVLVTLINQNAKNQKRASFKKTQIDNPKYAFRTWLTRLGMNGPRYKTTRKVLLKNLDGSGAHRNARDSNG